jgi:hypothetical protein
VSCRHPKITKWPPCRRLLLIAADNQWVQRAFPAWVLLLSE